MDRFPVPDVLSCVHKICSSHGFANSPRMQRFLRYVVDQALENRAQELKEYLIGVQVFDRPDSFDPRIDPIVRVEARRLRRKLDEYYQADGRSDRLRIDFQKGTYVPQFKLHANGQADVKTNLPIEANSIAVLPFRNIGPEPERDYFSDGLTEELIHVLTRVPGLRVVAWNSSAQMKNEEDFSTIRSHLNVAAMLRGTVRRAEDQLRITVQLVDTTDGSYVWSEVYNRRMSDILEIEAEIAQAIVSAFQVRGGVGSPPGLQDGTTNPESRRLYLLGRFHANRRTLEGLTKSVECYRRAIAADPKHAAPRGGLALAYLLLHQHFGTRPEEAVRLASESAQEALQLNPTLAEAHIALAFIRGNAQWKWAESETLYRRAMECNPGYATAHHWFGADHLLFRGRLQEASSEIDLASELDPLSPINCEARGLALLYMRRYEDALDLYGQVQELDPFFYRILGAFGRAHSLLGNYRLAIECFEEARRKCGDTPQLLGALGQTYALAGMTNEAHAVLRQLEELSKRKYVSDATLALVYIGLGETETALNLIERAVASHDIKAMVPAYHPAYDALRGTSRFEALMSSLNLG